MDNIMAESDNEEDNGLNIARRTRSHLRIDDFVPNDNLDFPDVDMNLYQNPDFEGDTEYKKFLNQCYSEEIGTDTNTEDNDPAYVYNDDIFSHGWRFDLNEVNELSQEATISEECQRIIPNVINEDDRNQLTELALIPAEPSLKSPLKSRRKIDMSSYPEFARILNQQLRQSIQLLTQTFLLTKSTKNMQDEAEGAKSHLLSYGKVFENRTKPSNLLPALELANNLPTPKNLMNFIRLSWRPLQIPESVKNIINSNPNIFIYPSLLPQVAFSNIPEKLLPEKLTPKKPKINFTINEDKLLAYALNEFKGETSQYAFIASLLMTAKTKTQINNHIKNIKRSPGNENNPIKLYYANGELPDIDLDGDSQIITETLHVVKKEENLWAAYSQVNEENKLIDTTHVQGEEGEEEQRQQHVQSNERIEHGEGCESGGTGNDKQKCDEGDKEAVIEGREEDEIRISGPPLQLEEQQVQEQEQQLQVQYHHQVQMSNIMDTPYSYQEQDDIMNMDLDDLMAASSTISKSTPLIVNNSENNKNIKNLKLKKSMLNLMSHNFLLSKDMGDLIIQEFLSAAQQKLSERNNLHLLQLLSQLMKTETKEDRKDYQAVVTIYQEITKFLERIKAPQEIHERIVLFLNLDQATKCGCSLSYLHWMRFFEFMQHVELYHDGVEAFEKKLTRLVDALQKDDSHKMKLAIANLVNKHPFLKREFESLSLDDKPHPSLFICEEDFDDITEPMNVHSDCFEENNNNSSIYQYEHFQCKLSEEELSYASQACPCKCHSGQTSDGQLSQHCCKCNLKFMKGRMYLVNKIKPILAEWSYTDTTIRTPESPQKVPGPCSQFQLQLQPQYQQPHNWQSQSQSQPQPQPEPQPQPQPQPPATIQCDTPIQPSGASSTTQIKWTLEEDKEILEFCRSKVEQNEETISFDTSTFEELVNNRTKIEGYDNVSNCKKSAREMAERFNQLMEIYKDGASSGVQ